ncbi:hypothetical protein QBC38DRAFT_542829 [Podospora fimiseda]|uniref:Uncharacterized protein n=1 Tax=Podospora fimiseda TaxID=252190 RepID=A0AAN7BW13_9PEZI|nr:hypothetical protein QBC38DRAFT_542829 [Podospora fimiseda]
MNSYPCSRYNTPSSSGNNTPSSSGNNTPSWSGNNTPSWSGNNTPSWSGNNTPLSSGCRTPPASRNTLSSSGNNTPLSSGCRTPPASRNTLSLSGYGTPSASGSNTPSTPARLTQSSYYSVNNSQSNSQPQILYARDVRAQTANLPTNQYGGNFRNFEGNPVPGGNGPLRHYPVVPGQQTAWRSGPQSGPPGAHRAVYRDGNPTKFTVVSHSSKAGTSGRGHGLFVPATYRPSTKKDQKDQTPP